MCKIIKYWFECQHGFRLRRSKCGGTKHKKTRSGPMPACKSDSYISIVLPVDCGPCQHLAFEKDWKRKLLMAELFLQKLKEKKFPGVQEVADLVEQLKDKYHTTSWDSRTRFPHVHKERTVRVSLGHFEKRQSPLRYEISPEDIPEPCEVIDPDHSGEEYDWEFVASADTLHPVDASCTRPLDDVDPSWMLNYFSPEEFEQASSEIGFNANEANAMWTSSLYELEPTSTTWDERTEEWTSETTSPDSREHNSGHSPEAQTRRKSEDAHMEAPREDQVLAERVAIVTQEFWSAVNDTDFHDQHS